MHGCKNPEELENAEVTREGGTLRVTCLHDNRVYHFACVDNVWIGGGYNCSSGWLGGLIGGWLAEWLVG